MLAQIQESMWKVILTILEGWMQWRHLTSDIIFRDQRTGHGCDRHWSFSKHTKKTMHWEIFKSFPSVRRHSRRLTLTTSTVKSRRVLMKEITNHSGVTSSTNAKTWLVWRQVQMSRLSCYGATQIDDHKNDGSLPDSKRRARNPIPPLRVTVDGVMKLLPTSR